MCGVEVQVYEKLLKEYDAATSADVSHYNSACDASIGLCQWSNRNCSTNISTAANSIMACKGVVHIFCRLPHTQSQC